MKNILYVLIAVIIISMAVGVNDVTSKAPKRPTYEQELRRAVEKNSIGVPLTKGEERRLKSYKKWEKQYDAEQYNKKHY